MTDIQQQDTGIAAPPANATEASARLGALTADKAWGDKLMAGDTAALKEFNSLTSMVAEGDDKIAVAMSGVLPPMANGEIRELAGTAEMLREIGIRDEVVQQTLEGRPVTQAEFDMTQRWLDRMMRDKAFTKAYTEGDPDTVNLMTLAHIILSSEIKSGST